MMRLFFLHGICVAVFILIQTVFLLPVNISNSVRHVPNKLFANMSTDLLKPPNHLEAVPLERNGHLNKNFHKEVLFGTSVHKKSKSDEALLKEIFKRADINQNGLLSQRELEKWIAAKIKEHFSQAIKDNYRIFSSLDRDHNGRVNWEEYHIPFLVDQGYDEGFAKNHSDHKGLNRKAKEKILLDKVAWSEAANSDPNALNIDEFLTFRHPEHSHVTLLNMVDDIIKSLDTDGDEILTEDEFSRMIKDESIPMSDKEWKEERITEFNEMIDANDDGQVTRQELLMYNDPENPGLARREAKNLIKLADTDNDGQLSLREILYKKDVFLGSKMVDIGKSLHDEF